jgi:pimeloyl-ACP methyl ester carboxylesterase
MNFSELAFTTADGPTIRARDYAAQGDARGLPVLCLHGLTRNAADFDDVAPAIAASGRRVIVPDARGRGRSDNDPEPMRYRPDVYVGDVLGLLDSLGIARAVFLGTSMGGMMAMLAAVLAPGRVAAAVLNDIGPRIDPAGLARIVSYVGNAGPFPSWAETEAAIRATQEQAFPGKDEDFWRVFTRRVARERPDGLVEFAYDPAISQAFAGNVPPPDLMPLFMALAAVPVLAVRGALSDILSRDGVGAMRGAKPDLEFVEVPGVGHAPLLSEPEAWSAIVRFLARVA